MTNDEFHSGPAAPHEPAGEQVKPELLVLTPDESKRFWSRVDKSSHPEGCWIWRGAITQPGYGKILVNGKADGAHRVSHLIHIGPIPDGWHVCHRCDVRNCVNPDHLWAALPKYNAIDRESKGRGRGGNGAVSYTLDVHIIPGYPAPKDPALILTRKQRHAFECKISRVPHPKGCWEWVGSRNRSGYGLFHFGKSTIAANRLAYRIFHGPMERGMQACHTCDNTSCVREDHLWKGTAKENSDDKMRKGRFVPCFGEMNGAKKHPERIPRGLRNGRHTMPERTLRGEKHGMAKLDEARVRQIRSMDMTGLTFKEVGQSFSVTGVLIKKIRKRELWKHVA